MQCGTITGIVIASAINIGTSRVVWGWRISLALAAVPGSILLLGTQLEIEFELEDVLVCAFLEHACCLLDGGACVRQCAVCVGMLRSVSCVVLDGLFLDGLTSNSVVSHVLVVFSHCSCSVSVLLALCC